MFFIISFILKGSETANSEIAQPDYSVIMKYKILAGTTDVSGVGQRYVHDAIFSNKNEPDV